MKLMGGGYEIGGGGYEIDGLQLVGRLSWMSPP